MKVIVVKPYQRPYENPIAVKARERVLPDFGKRTDIEGWVWCTADDGRSGWVPRNWLIQNGPAWHIDRNFNAIELTVAAGEALDAVFSESGFFWATRQTGDAGWVPCDHVSVAR